MLIKEAQNSIDTYVTDIIEDCPHCGARSHIESLWNCHHTLRNHDVEFFVVFRCKPCKKLILKTFLFEQNIYSDVQKLSPSGWREIFPLTLDDNLKNEEKEFIPPEVLIDYQEALKCKSIKAYRASASMFRRALQRSLLEIGADDSKDLIVQINSLGNLPPDIKDWSHQIRIFGNWGSHPDKDNLKDVNEDDVNEVHDFTSKFLTYIFIMPEKVKLSRAKRESKLGLKE